MDGLISWVCWVCTGGGCVGCEWNGLEGISEVVCDTEVFLQGRIRLFGLGYGFDRLFTLMEICNVSQKWKEIARSLARQIS